MKRAFFTYLVIFFLICSLNFAEKIITTECGYRIYYPELPYFFKEVSPFALGSITDPKILNDFGLLLAQKAKEANTHACIIGYAQLLSDELDDLHGHFDSQIAPFFSTTSFKASQTIEWIANGLTAGGIFPVLSAKFGIDDSLILNLSYRKIFPVILLEQTEEDQSKLQNMELPVIDSSGKVLFYSSLLNKLDWRWYQKLNDEELLRQELLIASIIKLKKRFSLEDFEVFHQPLNTPVNDRSVVFAKDPRIIDLNKFATGYLIHSTEDFILERIRLICSEIYHARGSRNW